MIGNPKKTNEILDKYGLRAKKGFGQNFLVDENILKKIITSANLSKNDGVIEIGPGIGALTEFLGKYAKKVLCFEIDKTLINVLEDNLDMSNIVIKNKDFLKVNLKEEIQYFNECKRILVISNLPYYITTPIIFKLLEDNLGINSYYFMVQKEVGQRITGVPKTKDYNALSVLMKYKTESEILFPVPRKCFMPSPNVDSVIIKIVYDKMDLGIINESHFSKFIQNLFYQRRKTLVNNLNATYNISKDQISKVLVGLNYSTTIRSEELNIIEISQLYKKIFE